MHREPFRIQRTGFGSQRDSRHRKVNRWLTNSNASLQDQISSHPKTRIAIIGSGMAGLSAAWMLGRNGFDVTVFEKGSRPGFSAHSRDFADLLSVAGTKLIGDIPSRMFNDALWPSLTCLYRQAGIEFQPVDHQQTFCEGERTLLKIGLPYKTSSLLLQSLNSNTRKLLQSIGNFRDAGMAALQAGATEEITFGQFVETLSPEQCSADMFRGFLMPALTATVFTCPENELLRYPSQMVLQALQSITEDASPLMRTTQGSRDAATRLLEHAKVVHFKSPVKRVTSSSESATVFTEDKEIHFDHVVIATQANHASLLIENSHPEESKLLKAFRYVNVPVVAHTDSTVMPNAKKDWSTFNFQSGGESATCTVWMNRFHSNWPETTNVFHSIFPSADIDSNKVFSTAQMQRPVVNLQTAQLHSQLNEYHSRDPRVWFAGSWAAAGVPLLESAVVSSQNVVGRLTSMAEKTLA